MDIIGLMTNTLSSKYGTVVLALFLSLGVLNSARGQNVVSFHGTPTPYSAGGTSINIYPEAHVNLPTGEIVKLSLSGKGLRQKFLAIVKVNAYVAIHYLDNPAVLNAQTPVESLSGARNRLMILQMIQNVTPEDIRAEFDDALDVNHVNLYSPEITALREQTTYYLDAGDRVYLAGYKIPTDDKEHIFVFTDDQSIQEQGSTLVTDIWRVWLGIPVDAEMEALKKSLLTHR